jgi:RNA polymerase sigma-70 factor (ECF subfamily)
MSDTDIDDEPIDTELLARMEAALETLPRFTREVFLAHRIDDLSYPEIAKITGTSVKRVEHEMFRALLGLTRALDGRPLRWWEWWF